MKKYFNIAGPCNPAEHYMIPPESRCGGVGELIDRKQYFAIHAARQSGKTTLLKEVSARIDREGRYYVLYCSLESVQGIRAPEKGIPAIVRTLRRYAKLNPILSGFRFGTDADFEDFNNLLIWTLSRFCGDLDKPLVLLFDETDCLSNGTLILFLRQLRDGYSSRDIIPFVHSVGLIGMRNIRDYKGSIREEQETLGSASPFNIVTESITLQDFAPEEVQELYARHTEETGQVFPPEVTRRIYEYTRGQPWLVNAVAREIILKILADDVTREIRAAHADQAVENIIRRRDTHIDSLLERLKEERVQRVVEPVITGEEKGFDFTDDDYQYVLDLGLMKNVDGVIRPSNPIYGDVIIRKLSSAPQMAMDPAGFPPRVPEYLENGVLNMKRLLTDFQDFWRENSTIWEERFQYKEAAPHLILMAFLQRIINAGGSIDREMATGKRRIDLCIHYGNRKYPVEIKIRRDKKTLEEGRRQLADYMDSLGCDAGWLVLFDRRKRLSWKDKLFWKTLRVESYYRCLKWRVRHDSI